MISEFDHDILRAFLVRESNMYRWIPETEAEHRKAFVDKLFDMIVNWTNDGKKFDYVHIQSISNMGLLSSELVLTADCWGVGQSLYLFLPPSHKGGIGFNIKEGK